MQNIIVGIESNGKQFIVGLSLYPIVNGKALEINSVRNVFPKNNAEWLNWISQGKLLYADKQKIQALIDKQRTILADVAYLDLDDVAKVVNSFENHAIEGKKTDGFVNEPAAEYGAGQEARPGASAGHGDKEGSNNQDLVGNNPDNQDGEDADIEAVNERFNSELEQYEKGTLPQGHRFGLGMPSRYLRSAGFPNLTISMRASLLARKAGEEKHPFEASDIKGLVDAMQKPIAIFEYTKQNMRNLIVDVKRGDKHFLVGVTLNYKAGDIEINSVSGLFPKESHEWVKWIQDGKVIRIDQKEKVRQIIDSLRTNPAESERIGLNLDDVAKVVNSFENPAVEGEKSENSREFAGNNPEDSNEYRTPEEGIAYVNARAIQPWSQTLDRLRRLRNEKGYTLNQGDRDAIRELEAKERAWEETWAAGHKDTDVVTGRRSRFDYYADSYGQGELSRELYQARRDVGPLNYSLISARARDMASIALPAIARRRADLLAGRPKYSRAGQVAIDTELVELDYMELYYQRMAAGEDVKRTMPGRIEHQRMLATANQVAEALGEKVVLYEAPGDIHDDNIQRRVRKQRSYGWYNPNDGTVHINVGRHRNAQEIVRTVLHEIVGHKTIEQIMAPKRFARLIDEIWNHAGKKVREKITRKMHKHGWDFREATKEYLSELAEEVHSKGYDKLDSEKKTIWQRVKAKVQDFLNRILEGLKIPARIRLTEEDLSYMMWKLYKHKQRKAAGKPAEGDIFDKAEEMVRREECEKSEGSMEIAARDGGNNQTMAARARAVIEQPAIEIVAHEYSKEELKRVYVNLPSVDKDGRTIEFYHSGFGKNFRPDGNFAKIVPQLNEILESSVFAYPEEERAGGEIRKDGTAHKAHRDIYERDNYVGKVKIGEQEYFVRFNVQNKKKESGVHSTMVTNVDIYKKSAEIGAIPTIHGGNSNYDRIVDAKLREFFESAKRNPDNLSDYMRSEMYNAGTEYRVREKAAPANTKKVYKLVRIKDGNTREWFPLFIDSAAPQRFGEWYDADAPDLSMLRGREPGQYLVNPQTKEVWTREEVYQQHPELRSMQRGQDTKYPSVDAINYATVNGLRWMEIEETARAQRRFDGKNRRYWNLGINGSGSVSTFSMRPGWHAGSLPTMRQIGKGKDKDLRDDRFVWVEGEVSADISYQEEADRNPDKDLPDGIPEDGYYMKATNADKAKSHADLVGWYVAGSFKANRFISDAEARQIIDDFNAAHPDQTLVEYDYERESGRTFDPEEGLHFRDGDNDVQNMSIEEKLLRVQLMVAERHGADVAVRDAAVESLGKTLGNIRRTMQVQHTYDVNTARALEGVARVLMETGTFMPEGRTEIKRLMGVIRGSMGRTARSERDFHEAVDSLMDLLVDNQLKLAGRFLDEMLAIKGSKVNARGVEVMGQYTLRQVAQSRRKISRV